MASRAFGPREDWPRLPGHVEGCYCVSCIDYWSELHPDSCECPRHLVWSYNKLNLDLLKSPNRLRNPHVASCSCEGCRYTALFGIVVRLTRDVLYPLVPLCRMKPGDFQVWTRLSGLEVHFDHRLETRKVACEIDNCHDVHIRGKTVTIFPNRDPHLGYHQDYVSKTEKCNHHNVCVTPVDRDELIALWQEERRHNLIRKLFDKHWETIHHRLWKPGGRMSERGFLQIEALLSP